MTINWLDGLLALLTDSDPNDEEISTGIGNAARFLGFDYYHFSYRQVLPFTKARMCWLSSYPPAWRRRYVEQGYMSTDPRINRAKVSDELMLWSDQLFEEAPELWSDSKRYGLCHGVTQSTLHGGVGTGMLSLARTSPEICKEELAEKREKIQQLTQLTYNLFSKNCRKAAASSLPNLSTREVEIMRWTADGKSARDIAEILELSKNTIDFHIKNTVNKLGTPNKTSAVILAASLGLL